MDIFNNETRKIRCIRNDEDVWGGGGKDAHLLTVGELYTCADVDVHGWHTLVTLKEFPGLEFNSVLFEEVE